MGATALLVVLLWLLLFVAPALFNAHTRTGLWAALSLFLAAPALIATVVHGLWRHARLTMPGRVRAQGEDDGIG